MESFLFATSFRRPNLELLSGEVHQLDDGAFKFHATGSEFYYFVIKKDGKGDWDWVDGHTASLERVSDLGEKVDQYLTKSRSGI